MPLPFLIDLLDLLSPGILTGRVRYALLFALLSLAPFEGTLCSLCPSKVNALSRSTLEALTPLYSMLCSITHTHSLFSVPFEALTVNTRDSARASFARVPLAYHFAILSLVSGPLLDRCGHLVAAIASSHTRAPRARSTGSPASLPQHRPLHEPFSRQGTALPAAPCRHTRATAANTPRSS